MMYHDITHDDMVNGDGLRVVLWVSGCDHKCKGCHNEITWNCESGLPFDETAKMELLDELQKPHIAGITFSGGDPFHIKNRDEVHRLVKEIKDQLPHKTIWIYSGYTWEQIIEKEKLFAITKLIDVLVDGRFIEKLADVNFPWAGSTNQRVIDVKETLKKGKVTLHECYKKGWND